MQNMYSSLAKSQAFPLAIKVSSKPRCFKQFHTLKTHSFSTGSPPKPSLNPINVQFSALAHGFHHKSHKVFSFGTPAKSLMGFQFESVDIGAMAIARASFSGGFRIRSAVVGGSLLRARSFSSLNSKRSGERRRVVGAGKPFPWLTANKVKEAKRMKEGTVSRDSRSSWEESAGRLEKVSSGSKSVKRLERGAVVESGSSSWEESRNRLEKRPARESGNGYGGRDNSVVEDAEGKESEIVDDPRWDKIKSRATGMLGRKGRNDKPEYQRWDREESWGRKTWKEASAESTLPKMVGEGVYGVGPVLAALSAGRREFYALYVQEGLELSGKHRKKKDKRGFERVLRMTEKIGLSIREIPKHDLNMVSDNRPHQGLVLDASPLEMVKVNELDPVLPEEEKCSLWVALDEVTDPQNLGAIIRSAYFFGASGVVLCAKNSAPLSGVVSKASAGSLELMELRYCKNMMQFLVGSADNGWRVLGGSVSSKAVPLNRIVSGKPTILVLGSEGTGLRPLVERSCTELVRIPGNIPIGVSTGGDDDVEDEETNLECSSHEFRSFLAVESLNVSVAAGVLLHHLIGIRDNDDCRIGDEPADTDDTPSYVLETETAEKLH